MLAKKIILAELKKHKKDFALVVFFMLLTQFLMQGIPALIRHLSDNILPALETGILLVCIGLVGCGLISYFSDFFADKYYTKIVDVIGATILENFVQSLFTVKKQIFSHFDSNQIFRIATNDIEQLKSKIVQKYFVLISVCAEIFSLVFFVIIIDWQLGMITLAWYSFYFFASRKLVDKITKSRKDERGTYTSVMQFSKDAIFGIFDLKYFGNIKNYMQEFHEANEKHITSHVRLTLSESLSRYLAYIGKFCNVAIIILYKHWIAKDVSTGTLLAMYMYSNNYSMIFMRLLWLRSSNKDIQTLEKPIDEFNSHAVGDDFKNQTAQIEKINEINVKDLAINFDEKSIVKKINARFEKGGRYVLDGKTGSGKSSIIYSLLNEIDYEGEILYNGQNAKSILPNAIYEKIGVIFQDVYLVTGTIRKNIVLFNNEITDGQVEDVAKFLSINELDKEIGSDEIENVSGGEKKRIALARPFLQLHKKDAVILDETFSSIDINTTRTVLQKLLELTKDKLFILVTHDEVVKEMIKKCGAEFIKISHPQE